MQETRPATGNERAERRAGEYPDEPILSELAALDNAIFALQRDLREMRAMRRELLPRARRALALRQATGDARPVAEHRLHVVAVDDERVGLRST